MAAPPRLNEALEEFLDARKAQGKAGNTIRQDRGALMWLLRDTGNLYVKSLTDVHVDRHFTQHPEWGPDHRASKIRTFRVFFRWATKRKYYPIGADPLGDYAPQRGNTSESKLRLPAHRFGELLDACVHPRDRMLVAAGLYLFLRGNESTALRIKDVDLDAGEVFCEITKTHEQDRMPISAELDTELRRWLTFYTTKAGPLQPDWFLIPAKSAPLLQGKPGTHGFASVQDRVKSPHLYPDRKVGMPHLPVRAALQQLGVYQSGEGSHTLRRSGARAYFDHLIDGQSGYDGALRQVSAMLHHANSATTERYLGIHLDRHRRNQDIRGKRMFGEPDISNVVEIRSSHG